MRKALELSSSERDRIGQRLRELLERHEEVTAALLFGSFLEGGRFHDIDVALLLDPERARGRSAGDVAWAIGNELERELRLPVDVVALDGAPIALRWAASRGEPLLVRDEERLDAFRERAWKEYLDFEPFLRQSLRDLLEG